MTFSVMYVPVGGEGEHGDRGRGGGGRCGKGVGS